MQFRGQEENRDAKETLDGWTEKNNGQQRPRKRRCREQRIAAERNFFGQKVTTVLYKIPQIKNITDICFNNL